MAWWRTGVTVTMLTGESFASFTARPVAAVCRDDWIEAICVTSPQGEPTLPFVSKLKVVNGSRFKSRRGNTTRTDISTVTTLVFGGHFA